ncbi:MAG TPA: PBP1A family penicillin-binding protein [Pyrinomonadaceae bacterium]|nr:PBP1A family penicillin-binding protein [Pyrinomonadaceae bacterium]
MSIEVTSVPDTARILSGDWLRQITRRLRWRGLPRERLLLRFVTGVVAIGLVLGGDSLLRSYKYYSRIIDARLASGYLTSRPGLYAAPHVLHAGQKYSQEKLIQSLRRAGYVESNASDVWSGGFTQHDGAIEIHSGASANKPSTSVTVKFAEDHITEIANAEGSLDSVALEPEPLSNDLSFKSGKREVLTFKQIPQVLVNAILAIEDRRFFEHRGVDIAGLARAAWRNAADERVSEGGSTITQQLVKNTYLSSEKTLQRKYAEAMLSVALERRLSKEDIFALYCNEVFLGQRGAVAVRGVKEAATVYFGKELKDLTVAEAATIAGMIQGPGRYSPTRSPEAAKERRNVVIDAMRRSGFISIEQAQLASSEPVTATSVVTDTNSLAPYFVDYVVREAEPELNSSGLTRRIYTTIDLDLQQLAEAALKHQLDRLDAIYSKRGLKPQAALVALNPKTGDVLAMVGGRAYAESQMNRATDARRQPGSTFKPFVYAAALEDGMSPVQPFMDAPREFVYDRNKIYRPANYGGGYSMQEVPMRTGLIKSLNVVTVDVALQTGLARIANLSERFGLPKPERYPSLALGTKEVTPLQLASAYAAFVNDGARVTPRVISSIGEPPGSHNDPVEAKQIVSRTTAYMITNMLNAVIDRGTAKKARGTAKGTAIAGKTGTSRDGWFVGYTPNLVCVVWIGFDDNQQLGLTGAEAALPAWSEFIAGAVEVRPDLGGASFECPEGIKFVEIDSATGLLSTVNCPLRELIAVTERTSPHLECYLHENVPPLTSPFAEESNSEEQTVVAQDRRRSGRENTMVIEFRRYKSTRVDVDAQGRRSLVNEMR